MEQDGMTPLTLKIITVPITGNACGVSLACQDSWMPYAVLTSDGGIPSGMKAPQLALQTAGSRLLSLPPHFSPYSSWQLQKQQSCRNEVRLQEYWMPESDTRNGAGNSRAAWYISLPKSKIVTNQVLLYHSLGNEIPSLFSLLHTVSCHRCVLPC